MHGHWSSSELRAHQMAFGRESDEFWVDEAGDDLDAAIGALRRWRRGSCEAAGGWRLLVVVVVFSQDKVLQRLVEQTTVDFFGPGPGSTALRGAGHRSAPLETWTIFLRSSLYLTVTAPVGGSRTNFAHFLRDGELES